MCISEATAPYDGSMRVVRFGALGEEKKISACRGTHKTEVDWPLIKVCQLVATRTKTSCGGIDDVDELDAMVDAYVFITTPDKAKKMIDT